MSAGMGRAAFLNGVTVAISHTPEQAPYSRIVGQCKIDSMFCFVLFICWLWFLEFQGKSDGGEYDQNLLYEKI